MKRILIVSLLTGAMLTTPAPVTAQVLGLPVFNSGVTSGLGIMGDVGFPNDDAGLETTYGATATLGVGLVALSATVARTGIESTGEDFTTLGAAATLKVFGGPLIPLAVTLQGGVGYAEVAEGVNTLHVPIGIGVALTIPSVAVAIKPWIAPRLDISRVSGDSVATAETESMFGISAGIDFNLINGLGFRAAYDLVDTEGGSPAVFSIGAGYHFRLPGL